MFEKSICTHERCPLIYENANWEMRRRRHIDDFTRQGGVSAGGIRNERYSIRSNTVDYGQYSRKSALEYLMRGQEWPQTLIDRSMNHGLS